MANLSEEELHGGPHYPALKQLAAARRRPVVPILGDLEVELQDFPPEERQEFLPGWVWKPGISRLVRESYRLLGLVTFYTIVGPEVRAWHRAGRHPGPQGRGPGALGHGKGLHPGGSDALRRSGRVGRPRPGSRRPAASTWKGGTILVRDGDILLFRFQR